VTTYSAGHLKAGTKMPKPRKGLVRIHRLQVEPLEVPAEIYGGVLAVHRVPPPFAGPDVARKLAHKRLWQITHAPTGLKIGEPFKRKPEAVAAVERLLEAGEEAWRFGTFGKQGTLVDSPVEVRRVVSGMLAVLYPSAVRTRTS